MEGEQARCPRPLVVAKKGFVTRDGYATPRQGENGRLEAAAWSRLAATSAASPHPARFLPELPLSLS